MGMTKAEREEKLKARHDELAGFDKSQKRGNIRFVAGTDEVGRGPLAGPVVTACVVLPDDFDVLGIDDSKKLSEKKRTELDAVIRENALAYGIGMRDNKRIDEINILNATREAMRDAVLAADAMLKERTGSGIDLVMFDAIELENLPIAQVSLIKGDATSLSIAAASIVAKVCRDTMMIEYANEYPYYAFEKNKGYGTAAHYKGINEHGITPIHRKSFLKNIYQY